MHRDIRHFTGRTFDALIVGGGVYGLTIACDASQRGLSVALVERGDFGSGSSFNHLRTIHGGLRYLQSLDFARARESIRERRTLAQIAPHAVHPQRFVLPLGRSLLRGKMAMRAGLLLDRLVAGDRNEGLLASHFLPAGTVVDRKTALERFPMLRGTDAAGAAIWYDYVATDADRLTLAWGLAARAHGALLANYVEATALGQNGSRGLTVHALDRPSGESFEINTRLVVNATGSAIDRLLAPAGLATGMPTLKAMNLVTSREAPADAIGGQSRTGRNLFLVPWRGRALFGTWESTQVCAPDDLAVSEADVDAFIADLNHAFPSCRLSRTDVTLVHRGVVPAVKRADGGVALDGSEGIHDHAANGRPEIVSVAGTKYTTARAVAERVTDRLLKKLGRAPEPCRTAETALPISQLTGADLLLSAARDEMVETLEDAVVRRTPLGALGHPGAEAVDRAATIVGQVLGWDETRRQHEIAALERFYHSGVGGRGSGVGTSVEARG